MAHKNLTSFSKQTLHKNLHTLFELKESKQVVQNRSDCQLNKEHRMKLVIIVWTDESLMESDKLKPRRLVASLMAAFR